MNHRYKIGARVFYKDIISQEWKPAIIVRAGSQFHPDIKKPKLYNDQVPYAVILGTTVLYESERRAAPTDSIRMKSES